MNDRVFLTAFGVSLALHVAFLVTELLPFAWLKITSSRPIQVVYEEQAAQEQLHQLRLQLERARREAAAAPAFANPGDRAQIRIPDRALLTDAPTAEDVAPERSTVIDLTNLVEASRGDPVLLSYFSAIREQIQQTANQQSWLTSEMMEGLVYVSFTLHASGAVERVTVVADRSIASEALRDTALRIVKAASPFPPFPPSMTEGNKTVVVPLEFLLGS